MTRSCGAACRRSGSGRRRLRRGLPRPAAAPADRCGARPRARARRAPASVSPASTGTAPCTMIGPASISGTTKCTVAPCCFAPAASARAWVSRPLNAGSSAGWMLSMPALPLPTNHGVSSRMKPARQTISISCALRTSPAARARMPRDPCRTAGDRRRRWRCRRRPRAASPSRRRARWRRRARSRPDNVGSFAASISATMLEPRPEIRMATRLRAMRRHRRCRACRCSSRAACPWRRRRPRRAARTVSPSRFEHRGDRVGLARLDHRDHADAAIEGAQHFRLGDVAGRARATGTPAAPARGRDRCGRRVRSAARAECCREIRRR